jgi:CubicO group peptidase (beta-lactamase class C family)
MAVRRAGGRKTACQGILIAVIAGHVAAHGRVPPARFADPERRQRLEAALPALDEIAVHWARDNKVPGLAWGIVIDGELARFGSVGQRNVEKGGAIDEDTAFRIASMTKSFTALAILKLRDAGKLELDAPVARYLPELASWSRSTSDSGPVTIRQLLTHTAGFPEDNPWGDRQMAISPGKFSAWLSAGIPFSTATGSAHEYSNYGFAMLGAVVTAVS